MPRLKDHPPASRKSQRLISNKTEQINRSTDDPTRPESETDFTPNTDSTLEDEIEVDSLSNTAWPNIETPEENLDEFEFAEARHTTPETNPNMMADGNDLASEIARLQAVITRLQTERQNNQPEARQATPENSAFGGTRFEPTGLASRKAFKPYGHSQEAANPHYSERAKSRGSDPGTFSGSSTTFDRWITKLADYFEKDNTTFRTERSRMAKLFSLLDDRPATMLETRYNLETQPYLCVAEMIQVLATVYHNSNQASEAWEKLSKIYFKCGPGNDVYSFIAEVNALADKIGVPAGERKTTLWQHIPADLDHRLLRDSKDPRISYEEFANLVADAAHSIQRAYREREERKQKSRGKDRKEKYPYSPDKNRKSNRGRYYESSNPNKGERSDMVPKTTEATGRGLTETEKMAHWEANTCFACGKEGHKSFECPNKTKAVRALDFEDNHSTNNEQKRSGKE
ncbi:hypothetical protein MCOR34_012008 [Pyricularia oryzae]|nr:hypothetical protein MCOR34_012008 [Pyricularia oryzae]